MLRILFNSSKRTQKQKAGSTDYFWNWFRKHRSGFEGFVNSGQKDFTLIHELNKQLKLYHTSLVGELFKDENGKYVLEISPDGHKEGVKPAGTLVKSAPKSTNWNFVAFKQPKTPERVMLGPDNFSYPVSDVVVLPKSTKNKEVVDLKIYIRNMERREDRYQQLAFLYLDNAIGEYNTIQRVRYVEFYENDGRNSEGAMTLPELFKWMQDRFN